MFFEGAEKKAEVIVNTDNFSLLTDIDDNFWQQLVHCCNAKILSSITNEHCKAFLLSESSLFVWHDRFVILTCGVTKLIKSVEFFIQQQGIDRIKHLIFLRKNEYFAQAQLSSFGDDIRCLTEHIEGKAYRFGELDSHHNYIFHQKNNYIAENDDKTYELLAYQISEHASNILTNGQLTAQEIRTFFQLDQLIPDFAIDDFVFDPYGYSLNAINGSDYLTIHVTPQLKSSYVSFESSLNLIELAPIILSILNPRSFDLVSYNEFDFDSQNKQFISDQYVAVTQVSQQLDNGYLVCFANYLRPPNCYTTAQQLDVEGENNAL